MGYWLGEDRELKQQITQELLTCSGIQATPCTSICELCAKSFQSNERSCSPTLKHCSLQGPDPRHLLYETFPGGMNLFLVSTATAGSLFLLPAHFVLFMPMSRRQNTCLIHMYVTCGGACLHAVQTGGARSKRNPVRSYPVLAPLLGAVRTCL